LHELEHTAIRTRSLKRLVVEHCLLKCMLYTVRVGLAYTLCMRIT